MVSVVPPPGELEGYGWVGAPPSMCSVVNRVISVPIMYFWTARTVSPAYREMEQRKSLCYCTQIFYPASSFFASFPTLTQVIIEKKEKVMAARAASAPWFSGRSSDEVRDHWLARKQKLTK